MRQSEETAAGHPARPGRPAGVSAQGEASPGLAYQAGDASAGPLGGDASDARLVEQARSGDDSAFAALVARYERKLVRVLARLVRDPELARDLAQETFWRVYSRLDRFDTSRRFGPWLFRVGVNLGLDWLRRHDPANVAPLSLDRPAADGRARFDVPDPDPRLREELAQEVQFVLAMVPVAYRTIVALRDLEGFSSAEVAAIVNRREATVRWRLAKGREMFREHWERREQARRAAPRSEADRP